MGSIGPMELALIALVALLLFGVWWNPLVAWSQQSLIFLRG